MIYIPMFDSNHVQNDFIYQTGGSTKLLLIPQGVVLFF
jgi:hypothetical protein